MGGSCRGLGLGDLGESDVSADNEMSLDSDCILRVETMCSEGGWDRMGSQV